MNCLSRFRFLALVFGFLTLFLGATERVLGGESWEVGLARESILPTEPIWMSGYASRDRPAEGTRTELWAKATVLKDATNRLGVILSLDIVGFGTDISTAICSSVMEKANLERSQIFINASHTHTGPVVGKNLGSMYFFSETESEKIERYTEFLVDQSVSAVMRAIQGLKQATISYGIGQARFGVNRRNNPEMLVPKIRFEGELKGPVDYSVPVLRIADSDQRTVGILFGYACHATTLSDYQWSGDYPGYAQQFVEARYPGAMAQFIAGCGADINPLPRRKPELAVAYGGELARSVSDVLRGVMENLEPQLQTRFSVTKLRFDKTPGRDHLLRESASEDRYVASRARKWLGVIDAGGVIPTSYEYPLSWWRLGNAMNFVGMGGEVVVEYALAIKQLYGSATWVAGYSHDVMAYIPSKRIWLEGGYEGATSMIYYGQPDRWSESIEDDVLGAVQALSR
jgi:neutral ceramidase